jgi:hypothetical protein
MRKLGHLFRNLSHIDAEPHIRCEAEEIPRVFGDCGVISRLALNERHGLIPIYSR